MPTRDLSNKRVQIWLGPASAVGSFEYATEAEIAALIAAAPAVRWDGLDFGAEASEQVDDRSLDDDATATLRGFKQFGGGIPFFFPKASDQSSVLRQVFDLVKVRGAELVLIERIGWVDRKTAATAGDNINIYKVMSDGYTPDTEGDGGYAYIQSMIPRGENAPWTIVRGASPTAVTVAGGAVTGTVGTLALRRANYLGNDITNRATWTSTDEDVAIVDNRGIIELVGAGTASVAASFPGGTASTALSVTVS